MAGITLNIANALAAARDLGAQGWAASEMLMALRIGMAEGKGLLQDMTRIIARRTITEPLGNAASAGLSSIGAGNWLNDIGTAIGGLFRADGGPVAAGQPYIVGERGPEWFVPNQAGTVLPNGSAPSGTTINTSIAIDARGADAGVEARLRLLAGQIARQASSMTLDAIRRGGSAYETVRG